MSNELTIKQQQQQLKVSNAMNFIFDTSKVKDKDSAKMQGDLINAFQSNCNFLRAQALYNLSTYLTNEELIKLFDGQIGKSQIAVDKVVGQYVLINKETKTKTVFAQEIKDGEKIQILDILKYTVFCDLIAHFRKIAKETIKKADTLLKAEYLKAYNVKTIDEYIFEKSKQDILDFLNIDLTRYDLQGKALKDLFNGKDLTQETETVSEETETVSEETETVSEETETASEEKTTLEKGFDLFKKAMVLWTEKGYTTLQELSTLYTELVNE